MDCDARCPVLDSESFLPKFASVMAHSHLLDYFRCSNLVIVYNTRTYVGMYRDGNTSTTIDTAVVYSPYQG